MRRIERLRDSGDALLDKTMRSSAPKVGFLLREPAWNPPPDMLYSHRKLGGLFLLLKRLGAKVPMSELIASYLDFRQRKFGSVARVFGACPGLRHRWKEYRWIRFEAPEQ